MAKSVEKQVQQMMKMREVAAAAERAAKEAEQKLVEPTVRKVSKVAEEVTAAVLMDRIEDIGKVQFDVVDFGKKFKTFIEGTIFVGGQKTTEDDLEMPTIADGGKKA